MSRSWYFREFRPGDTQKDPISGAFFQQDALTDTAEALVRESVQNSLDATPPGSSTRVRFRVIRKLSREARIQALKWVEELEPHVAAPGNGLPKDRQMTQPEPIIVIEDFGTRGLTGDPDAYQANDSLRNDFFAFFRAEGYHQKSAQSLGKWGIGKTVFPRTSRLNLYFGYSLREGDPLPVLMGRAILKTHTVADGRRWHPDGYMGLRRDDGLILPFREAANVRDFCQTFDLQRVAEPGLSVVVPYADPDIDESHLLSAAVHDYFVPLLEGRLQVDVEGDDPEDRWTLNSETLPDLLQSEGGLFSEVDRARIAIAQWALGSGQEEIDELPAVDGGGKPRLEEVPIPDVQLDRLRSRMNSGKAFSVRQPFPIRPKDGEEVLGALDVFFHPAEVGVRLPPVFVRDGIVIWEAGGKTTSGWMAFVLVSGEAAAFVGASENVAHTAWNSSREGFRDSYKYAAGTLTFVKNFPADFLSLLRTTDADQDPELLSDVFFLDVEEDPDLDGEGEAITGKPKRPGPGVSPPSGEGPAGRTRYSITRRDGGFTIANGERAEPFVGELRIRAAYLMRRKNPLSAYDDSDFGFERPPITVETEGDVHVMLQKQNELILQTGGGPFSCAVRGFDQERDLFVKVDVIREATADDDA